MSKLSTIYNVMKQMQNEEGIKGSAIIKLNSQGEEIYSYTKDYEFDLAERKNHCVGHKCGAYHKANFENIPEEMKEKFKERRALKEKFGSKKDYSDEMKENFEKASKQTSYNPLDRGLMMIKLLDKTELIDENSKQVLSLNLTSNDLPKEFENRFSQGKKHPLMFKKIKQNHGEKYQEKFEIFEEVYTIIEKSGIEVEDINIDNINLKFAVDENNKIDNVKFILKFIDGNEKKLVVDGQIDVA